MFDSFNKIFEKASTKGDVATVLVFGTAGFLIDAGLNAVGFLEPGIVGITAASGALGVKKSIDSILEGMHKRKDEKEKRYKEEKEEEQQRIEELASKNKILEVEVRRAFEFRALLNEDQQHENLVRRLDKEIRLFKAGIISLDAFRNSIDEIVNAYRSSSSEISDFNV